jgi:hypothetical protein
MKQTVCAVLIGISLIVVGGQAVSSSSPTPSSYVMPPMIRLDGKNLSILLKACQLLKEQKNLACDSKFLRNKLVVIQEFGDFYAVLFDPMPVRLIDQGVTVNVDKPI